MFDAAATTSLTAAPPAGAWVLDWRSTSSSFTSGSSGLK